MHFTGKPQTQSELWARLKLSRQWTMDEVMLSASGNSVVVVVALLLDQLVDVVLGAVLAGGHLEHVGGAEEGLLRVPVGDHLQCRYVDIENRYVDIENRYLDIK